MESWDMELLQMNSRHTPQKWNLKLYTTRGHVWFDVRVSSLRVAQAIINAFRQSKVLHSWSASRV